MSPRHCDSPLLTFKSSKVKRKIKTPLLCTSTGVESGWLGKKTCRDKDDKTFKTTRKTYSGKRKTPLSTTKSLNLNKSLREEIANEIFDNSCDG